jgi:RHS repeat-associated protein
VVNGFASASRYVDDLAYSDVSATWTTNPATGQAWTASEVNALQAGVRKVSGFDVDVTQVYVDVSAGDWITYAYANGPTGMNTLTSATTRAGVTTSFAYDANGNLASKFGATKTCYAWNPENLLAQVKTVSAACTEAGTPVQSYTYDGLGRRLNVTTGSTWTASIPSGSDVIFEKDQSGAVTKYVTANGMRIAKINPDGSVYYYLADHLGSTRKVLRADRTEAFAADYEPFGKPYAVTGTESYKYTSERHDDPTGLVYLRARQYDPDVGRFVSADPVLGSLSRPQTLNRYTYVSNNPLTHTDPSGQSECNAAAADYLLSACERWASWHAFTGEVNSWLAEHRKPWDLDTVMMLVSFVPVVGLVADVYFLGKALHQGFTTGEWDWWSIGLSAVGVAGFAFGMVRALRMLGHADELADAARAVDLFSFGTTKNLLRHAGKHAEELGFFGRGMDTARAYLASAKSFIRNGLYLADTRPWRVVPGSLADVGGARGDLTIIYGLGNNKGVVAAFNPMRKLIRSYYLEEDLAQLLLRLGAL